MYPMIFKSLYLTVNQGIFYQVHLNDLRIIIASQRKMEVTSETICPLCSRDIAAPCNRHHLIPKSKGGKNTLAILLHKICHDKMHAVFKENDLKKYYNTFERLQQHEEMAKFIKWVQNKEPEFYDKSVKLKSRKVK
jgi:hypothetical protein